MTEVLATEATLNTLSVQIQALVVSGKQMTLAVFRQLPNESPLGEGGKLADFRFWGRVRYLIKDEGDHWAVAERKGKLHRCLIWDEREAARNEYAYELSRKIDLKNRSYPIQPKLDAEIATLTENHNNQAAIVRERITAFSALRDLPQLFIAV